MLSIPPLRSRVAMCTLLLLPVLISALPSPAPAIDIPLDPNCCMYTVNGSVWYDQNANGIKEGSEPVLVGWTVQVMNASNVVVGSTTTNGLGQYSFTVPVGCGFTFKLKQMVQSGWTQTFPPSNGWHTGFGTGCGNAYGPYDFGNTQPDCAPFTKTYTLDADFYLGTLNGVVTNSDQLELSQAPTTWPFAWVANAGEGTISKIDTQTGNEVARYYTGPPDNSSSYAYLYPSRTVVDRNGNCWVANRNTSNLFGSITQIALSGGIDWNNNSVINTSSDANNNGQIDPWEILPWGQDERVIRHYRLGGANEQVRGMTLDKMGYLWAGLCAAEQLVKVDPNLPTSIYAANNPPTAPPILATINLPQYTMPYGLALSPNGLIYMSTVASKAFEIDPGVASGGTNAGPAITKHINHGGANYGLAVDKNCIVWLAMAYSPGPGGYGCVRWDPSQTVNPSTGWTYSNAGTPAGMGRGIGVDFNNDIWMACNDANNSVVKFSNTPTPNVIGVYPTPSWTPVGVGPASDGNIVVTPSGNSLWCKLDVNTGAVLTLPGPQLVGYSPYTYSDFTGSGQMITGTQQGTWTVITDGGSSALAWNFIGWNGLTPPNTGLVVEARVAQTIPALATKPWITIAGPGPLGTPIPGRYIETRVRLQRFVEGCAAQWVTPILYDLTVAAICDPCAFASCAADTTIQCQSPQGAEFFYPTPLLKSICDSTYVVTCSPGSGFFPMGTTPVTCTAVNAEGDTVICQFNVTVTGNCDPPPTGACCLGTTCSVTTEANCQLLGGIYFGNNTNCNSGGCNRNCAVVPNNLVAWWPMEGGSGALTPNLAGPATGGVPVNNPAPRTGEKVGNSYEFDGTSQYFQVPHDATLNLGAGDFSVDAWVRTAAGDGMTPIVDKRNGDPLQGFAFFLNNGYPALQLAVDGLSSSFVLDAATGGPAAFVADGSWHLLAVTVSRNSPTGVRFYVDGQPVGEPFDPTGRHGSLDTTAPLLLAHTPSGLGNRFFPGGMDEVEIVRRALSAEEVYGIFAAGASGKCPETCYASQNVPCCGGLSATSAVTICNYSLAPHVYSWGITPVTGGACAAASPTGFTPSGGTLTVAAQSCVTIPLTMACPSNVPIGQSSCYQVSIFNHDTGRLFGCQGSVRRTLKWCWRNLPIDLDTGVIDVPTGQSRMLQFEIANVGEGSGPEPLNYMIRPLAGDTGLPSAVVSLNGLPPGEPVLGTLTLGPGGTATVSVEVAYSAASLIGYDRLVISGDEDGDGLDEMLGEAAVRSTLDGVAAVPEDPAPPTTGQADGGRLLLVFPNPFRASDQIRFRVDGSRPAEVKLQLFDLMGRTVKNFYNEQILDPGEYNVRWNTVDDRGERLQTGIYFLKLKVGARAESVKILVRR